MPIPLEVYETIDEVADFLYAKGVEMPDAYKRRDPREPGRALKERWEDKLRKLVRRRFLSQKDKLKKQLEVILPPRKNAGDLFDLVSDSVFIDEKTEAKILQLFIMASQDGVNLFQEQVTIGLDWELVNTQAAEFAREYMPDFLGYLDDTTMTRLRAELQAFTETPGYTMGDIISNLDDSVFKSGRAELVARDQITKIFARADNIAARELAKTFPEVAVIMTWFTNRSPNVCDLCRPMDGAEALAGEPFVSPATGAEYDGPGDPHPGCMCWQSSTTRITEQNA